MTRPVLYYNMYVLGFHCCPAEQLAKAVHLFSSPLFPPSGSDSLEDNSDDYEEPDLSFHGVHRVNTADRVKSVECFLRPPLLQSK